MEALATELRLALGNRLQHLKSFISETRAGLGAGRQGLRDALEIVSYYPDWVRREANATWQRAPNAGSRVSEFRSLLSLVSKKSLAIEDWFSRAKNLSVPLYLLSAVERECHILDLGTRHAVVAINRPDSFETLIPDLYQYMFTGIGPPKPEAPKGLRQAQSNKRFAMIQVPRYEGSEALWSPIILGHELAHLRIRKEDTLSRLSLPDNIDIACVLAAGDTPTFSSTLGPTQTRRLQTIARNWAEEILCDAWALRRFGPAALASIAEFLETVGATDRFTTTHPPGWLRVRMLVNWLGTDACGPSFRKVIAPWQDLSTSKPARLAVWLERLMGELEVKLDYMKALADWSGATDHAPRAPVVSLIAADMKLGLPAAEHYQVHGAWVSPLPADVLNAGWIGRAERFRVPVGNLVLKSLDTIEFITRWKESKGKLREESIAGVDPTKKELTVTGGVSAEQLLERLQLGGPLRLVVNPMLPGDLQGSSVDVRLGNNFIVFRRSSTSSFDPLSSESDPRVMQEQVERAWGELFVLHPGELVLAVTLQYIALPCDLSAQVITRSSYGRLGLITATAAQVHPNFRGCLTLELVNLGDIPLALTPGERLAQLVFTRVAEVPTAESKYDCPTRPEFSKVRSDFESQVLRRLRSRD